MIQRVLPPPGLPRQLVAQSALVAVGWGIYLTGSVVFFSLYVGLTPVQIGLGFSISGLLGLVLAMPLGHLADRFGGQRAWVAGSIVGVVAFLLYPLVGAFWSFVVVLGMQAVSQALTDAGRSVYTAAAVPAEIRVRTMAFVRAYLNMGFTVGAGLGAVAIALDSRPGLLILVLANAGGILVSACFVARMPAVHTEAGPDRRPPWGVLRDHPFTALTGVFAILSCSEVLFSTVVPLWAITSTDAPRPVLGALFALNTVLAVLLQVPATRHAVSLTGSANLTRWAALSTVAACVVFLVGGRTQGWLTIAVLALGVVLLTGTELWSSAAEWYFVTEVPPPDRRGVYLGAARTGSGVARMIGPVALTFLAVHTGGWGWWVIAALFAVAALLIHPVVAWVGRTPRALASASTTGPAEPRAPSAH
ncbi:MFS transporter [Paractinoplanes lichenicola]|uniref:MFS transporter n=1 Tax=Paractinoplanes lichenicola TaxID=2802976 RepID=A0ABS1VZA1_9ACTN|nr:MFS transporter [Actinoplanes lichenicola]MBL7259815.1 MFS transporter [Actinoplanes lichenicola]